MMHVTLTVVDHEATVYREIPADILERLMSTDDTATLAEIARQIQGYVKAAEDAVVTSYEVETGLRSFADATADAG